MTPDPTDGIAFGAEPTHRLETPLDEAPPPLSARPGGMSLGVVFSIAAHLAVFGGAWVYANRAPPRLVQEKPIVAKLVRLGKPRDEKLLPRLPKTPTAPPQKPVAVPQPTPQPSPTAKPEPAPSPTAKAEPVPETKPAPKVDAAADALARQEQMLAALARVSGPTSQSGEEELPGQADGDVLGTADEASEGDRYLALVEQSLRSNYILPTTISAKERLHLACVLYLKIAPSGKVESFEIIESSGNPHFDRAVEASVRQTLLPPPPDSFRKLYRDGLEIRFKP